MLTVNASLSIFPVERYEDEICFAISGEIYFCLMRKSLLYAEII
jgi:hypothetical protein